MDLYQYNEEMLFEDINFPLRHEHGCIFDKSDNIIVRDIDNDVAKKLTGKYKEIDETTDRYENDLDGNLIDRETSLTIGVVDVWSRLIHKDEPTHRTQNVIYYITDRLNAL